MKANGVSEFKIPLDLGFLEIAQVSDQWNLESRYFPSKLGGKPAWLNLQDLPSPSLILCPNCNIPRSFLCQLYAPIEAEPNCFHRTLFVFICRSPKVCYITFGYIWGPSNKMIR